MLFDVYIRTHLTFSAAAWAPKYLQPGALSTQAGPVREMAVWYRRSLRLLSGADPTVRTEVLCTALVRWPLEVPLAKAVQRYYARLLRMMGGAEAPPVAVAATWAWG